MIKTDIILPVSYGTDDIKDAISKALPIEKDEIIDLRILKRRLDVSDKSKIVYKTSVGFSLAPEREQGLLKIKRRVFACESYKLEIPEKHFSSSPVVVGAGPAGLFAALALAMAGACPTVLERGLPVDERQARVDTFNKLGILDTECNIQFGEGGAGTFSDGKLKYGAMDKYKWWVLNELVASGADDDILYTVGAHVGTDKLSEIVKKIREKIISLGGSFIFSARLSGIKSSGGRVIKAVYQKGGKEYEIETDVIVLATGHSADDTFEILHAMGVPMEARGFGVGMRIEHKREYIDRLIYGENPPSELGAASYHLVSHLDNGRSVYSFCMCPGGVVVPAASREGAVVTNGMSCHARNGENSNSALLVSVTPSDFDSESPLSALEYRRKLEISAFKAGGGGYQAPAISLESFMNKSAPALSSNISPSYSRGVIAVDPCKFLPSCITSSLMQAMHDFDAWLPGFYSPDAILTGTETRSTSPIRIFRDEGCECPSLKGLFPTGEGAGYAGGIISSATDGVRVAEKVLRLYGKTKNP